MVALGMVVLGLVVLGLIVLGLVQVPCGVLVPIKTEREGSISNTKKIKGLCTEGRFVSTDVLYLWTFCRLDIL
jgi:hypothetical protein